MRPVDFIRLGLAYVLIATSADTSAKDVDSTADSKSGAAAKHADSSDATGAASPAEIPSRAWLDIAKRTR